MVRSLCTDLGAANHYDLEHLKKPEIWSLVENAQMYYIGGFHFTVCPPAIMELAQQAAQSNKPFVLSLSAPFIPQFFKEVVDASAPYWDYIIGNETEAAAYAEPRPAFQGAQGCRRPPCQPAQGEQAAQAYRYCHAGYRPYSRRHSGRGGYQGVPRSCH